MRLDKELTCEGCEFFNYSPGGQIDDPYPAFWCGKGHWEGGPMPEADDPDVWKDCADFEPEAEHEFRRQLQHLRNRNNLSIRALARFMGVDPTMVSEVQSGRRKPSVKFIKKLCRAFSTDEQHWNRIAARAHGWKV